MADSGSIRAGSAYIEIGTKDSFSKSFRDVENRLRSLGNTLVGIGARMGALGTAISAPLLVAVQRFTSMGNEINRASQRTGIAVQALIGLKYAAEQSGSSLEEFENGIKRMQRNLLDVAEGTGKTKDALTLLKLTLHDLSGLSPDAQFKLIASRLDTLKDAGIRAGVAMQIFGGKGGQGGTGLLPFLAQGADGISRLQKRAEELGITFSTADAVAATKFTQTLNDLWNQLQAVTFQFGAAISNALQPFATAATKVMANILQLVKSHRDLAVIALALGASLTIAGTAVLGFGLALKLVATSMAGFRAGIGAITTAAGLLTNPIVLVGLAVAGLAAYFVYTTQVGQKALTFLGQKFTELKTVALTAFGGISDALASGDILLAANILWVGLKLLWATGTQELRTYWIGFKNGLTQTAIDAFYGVETIWENVKAILKESWQEAADFFGNIWDAIVGTISHAWNKTITDIAKGINYLHGLWDKKFDVAANNAALENALQNGNNAAQNNEQAAQAKRNADRDAAIKSIEAEKARVLGEIQNNQLALDHAADTNATDDIAALQHQRDDLQRQLKDLRDKAAHEKEQSDKNKPQPLYDPRKDLNLDDVKNLIQPLKSVGTFNASAGGILGLNGGSGGHLSRIAKATEETAKNTRKKKEKPALVQSDVVYG